MKTRILSLLLTLTMLMSIVPSTSMAANGETEFFEILSDAQLPGEGASADGADVSDGSGAYNNHDGIVPASYETELISDIVEQSEIIVKEGYFGDNLTWKITGDKILYIDGNGDMPDMEYSYDVPWNTYWGAVEADAIEKAVIGDGVTNIDRFAFEECKSLKEVVVGKGVSSIEYGALGISGIACITVDNENAYFSSDSFGVLFNKDKTTLIQYPASAQYIEYQIPDTVKIIGGNAFTVFADSDTKLEGVVIPESVTNIEASAFSYCTGLKKVCLPNSITEINDNVFNGCRSLLLVEFSDNLVSIGNSAFEGNISLESITLPDGVESVGQRAFASCESLADITIPGSVVYIGDSAFEQCAGLTDVYYGDTAEKWASVSIGSGNSQLTGASIQFTVPLLASGECGNGVTWTFDTVGTLTISGSGAMTDWSAATALPWYNYAYEVKNVVIEQGVTTVGSYAFCSLGNMRSITIAESVTKIGNSSFNGCILLKSVVIPKNAVSIGWSAFYNCASLKTVTLYDSVTSIGKSAFHNCSVLSDVFYYGNALQWSGIELNTNNTPINAATKHYIVPEASGVCGSNLTWKLTSDGTLTVSGTGAMTNFAAAADAPWYSLRNSIVRVVVADGITSVSSYAFCGYPYLVDVVLADTVTSVGNSSFNGDTALKSITLPQNVTTVGWSAFYNCTGLVSVTLGNKITKIGSGAFNKCTAIKYVYYYGSADDWSKMTVDANNTYLTGASRNYISSGNPGKSGVCGNGLSWVIDSDNTLTVSGSGAMTSWSAAAATPWYDYRNLVKNIVIEDGVTTIGSYAFCGFSAFTSISIPNSVTNIGNSTFNTCTSLERIEIPASVTSIGWSVFYSCTSLYSIKMSNGITSIGASAFYKCNALKEVYYSGTQEQWEAITIGTNNEMLTANTAKHFGNILGSGICGDSLTWELSKYGELTIDGNGDMYNWENSRSVPWAEYASKINKVVMTDGVTSVGNNAFADCANIKSVTLSSATVKIGVSAFAWCEGISVIALPASVSEIGDGAFTGCISLKRITVESGNTAYYSDSHGVLYDASGDTLVCYPAGNNAISYEIPAGTQTIGKNAFCMCNILNMIIIPDTVTVVEDGAFDGCECIGDVYYSGSEDSWNAISFGTGNEFITGANIYYMYVESLIDEGECGDNLTWELNSSGILVISGSGKINSYIASDMVPWSKYSQDIKKIILEEGITVIGSYAFAGLENITSVRIPDGVTTIEAHAFEGCSNITSITLPYELGFIGEGAFSGLSSLADVYYASTEEMWAKISIGDNNGELLGATLHLSFIDNTVDSGTCGESLTWKLDDEGVLTVSGTGIMTSWNAAAETPWYAHYSSVKRIVVEEGIENIGAYAFCNFTALKSVSLPDSVKTIENSAFNGCIKLDGITVPNGVTSIGWSAFYNCNTMYEVTFFDTLTSIGASAFYKCSLLNDIYYHGNGKQWEEILIDSGNTQLSNAVKHFIVPEVSGTFGNGFTWELGTDGVLTVNGSGDMLSWSAASATPWYEYRSSVTKIVVNDGITSIGNYAFSGFTYLTDIVIADSVTNIGHSAFSGAALVQSVILPDELTTLGWSSFYNCTSLASVTFGSKINSIGSSAFNSCSSLKYVYYYGTEDGWGSVSVGNNNPYLTKASKYFVSYGEAGESGLCGNGLTWTVDGSTLKISGSGNMTSWSAAAEVPWYGLRNEITKAVIEDGTVNIGDYAFCGFKVLSEVSIADSVASIGNSSFNTCVSLSSVAIPNKVTTIGWSAFYACYGLETLSLPASVTKIGASAFYNCKNLKDVYYSGSEAEWNEIVIGVDNNVLTIDTNKHFGNILYSGVYGTDLTWQIDKFGTLTIIGVGEIPATVSSSSELPWNNHRDIITKVVISEGIDGIADYAFRDMLMTEISVPSTVIGIGERAFSTCRNLKTIAVDSANGFYTCDDSGVLYEKDMSTLICAPSGAVLAGYVVPDTVISIAGGAFEGNTNLVSIVIPNGINNIQKNTFSGCSSLEEITIPASVTNVEAGAFYSCDSLNTVYCGHTRAAWESVVIEEDGNDSLINAQKVFALPSGTCGDGLTWELDDDGTLTVSGMGEMTSWVMREDAPWFDYMNEITSVVISDGVTSIGDYSFCEYINLSQLSIAPSVEFIGMSAFEFCENLMQVTLPEGVSELGSFAFSTTGISEINLPASLIVLGDGVFYNCFSLNVITVDEASECFASDDSGVLYDKYFGELICCPAGMQMTEYTAIESIGYIRNFAFAGCRSLESIVIPEADSRITEISIGLFVDCMNLKSVYIPGSVIMICDDAFYGCDSLTDLYFGNSEDVWNNIVAIGSGNDFSNVTLHFEEPFIDSGICGDGLEWKLNRDGLLEIYGDGDMYDYSDSAPWSEYADIITNVIFEGNATSIGAGAFSDLSMLMNIMVPESLTSIGAGAFENCTSLMMIYVPTYVTHIDDSAFKGCDALEMIDVAQDNEVYSSDEYGVLFSGDKTTLIYVPSACMATDYTVPYGVETIRNGAFSNSCNISSVILPDTVSIIENSAFSGCMNLSYVHIPDKAVKIGQNAFSYTPLSENGLNSEDGVLYIGNHLIDAGLMNESSYTVKEGTVSIADYAFCELDSFNKIVIPDSLIAVGEYAFDGCIGLNSVIFCGKREKWEAVEIGSGNDKLTEAALRCLYTVAEGECGENLTWTLNSEGLMVISGIGDMAYWTTELDIPWYGYRSDIKAVEIGENVTSISTSAFCGCRNMTEISLPDSLTSIGDGAFMECMALAEINIPSAVSHIGNNVFDVCPSLGKIVVADENTVYSSDENGILFNKEKTTMIKFPSGSEVNQYTLPETVTYISGRAFENASTLSSVIFGNSVTQIDEYAFSNCTGLTTVALGDGITIIGDWAFENCENLSVINLPDSVTTIGMGAFSGCAALNEVYIGSGIKAIGDYAFENCSNISEVYYNGYREQWSQVAVGAENDSLVNAVIHFKLPGGVCGDGVEWKLTEDNILIISGNGAMTDFTGADALPWYEYSSKITALQIEDGVTTIGNYAFCNLSKLKTVTIADTVTRIGNSSFNSCVSLKDITIPCNVETIGWSAFYNCNQMTSITMHSSITSIGASAFNKCSVLQTIYFYGNEQQWKNIEIGATNVPITAQAKLVYYVEAVEDKFGENITWSLSSDGTLKLSGTGAMPVITSASEVPWSEYVSSVRRVVIGNGITDIGAYVFEGHTYMTDVVIGSDVTKLGNRAFKDCTSLKSVTLPENVTTLGGSVFYGCSALAHVTAGSKLKAVGVSSFNGCSALKYVYYYGTAQTWANITITSSNTYLTNATRVYVASGSAGVSGVCGDSLTWTFDGDETLTVRGTGAMTSWSTAASTPWYDLRNRVTKIVVENGVTAVGSYAFCAFASLKEVVIPDTVTSLGNSTFNSCTALENITIPSSVSAIGWSVFYGCSSLDSITLYNSITSIGASAFYRCSKLKTVYFYGTENEWNEITRGTNNEALSIATLQLIGEDDGTYVLSANAYVAGGNIVVKAKTDKLITDQHLHVALYNDSSKLVDYILVPMDEAFDRVNVVFKDNCGASYAKVFLWESLTSLTPVTEAVTVEIPR